MTAAEALAWAIDRLDSEEHRYVERFAPCPNGCEFDYQGDYTRRPVRTAGPADCDTCDDGVVEDEDARHIDPQIAALRTLAFRLVDGDALALSDVLRRFLAADSGQYSRLHYFGHGDDRLQLVGVVSVNPDEYDAIERAQPQGVE